jgi:hypothetical protein
MKNQSQRQSKPSFGEFFQDLVDLSSELLAAVRDGLPSEPEILPLMKYDDAIRYFVTERPKDPKVKKGAMLRQRHRRGYLFTQMFVDEDNRVVFSPDRVPYSRQLVVKQFDEELREAFGDKDLIIVE